MSQSIGSNESRREGTERRTEERVPYSIDVTLRELSDISGANLQGPTIVARVENLSQKGMCVSSRVPLMFSTSVRCDVAIKDLLVSVPTVAQVRWVEKSNSRTYLSGLQYLL